MPSAVPPSPDIKGSRKKGGKNEKGCQANKKQPVPQKPQHITSISCPVVLDKVRILVRGLLICENLTDSNLCPKPRLADKKPPPSNFTFITKLRTKYSINHEPHRAFGPKPHERSQTGKGNLTTEFHGVKMELISKRL
jgi:hypothetical protein